jgi:phage baseplate assembly protein V
MTAQERQLLTDLARRVENMLRQGVIAEVDHSAARCRVRAGGMLTGWIQWATAHAAGDRDWWPPEPGEQVIIMCPGGDPEQGVAVRGLYQAAHPAPSSSPEKRRLQLADGSVVDYDRATHQLTLTVIGNVVVTAGGHAAVTANTISLDGASGGGVKGMVQGDCLCAFTGHPHPQISGTVRGSK